MARDPDDPQDSENLLDWAMGIGAIALAIVAVVIMVTMLVQ